MYVLDKDGKRVYTLKKVLNGEVTKSAHPARFSPDDKYSRYVEIYIYITISTATTTEVFPRRKTLVDVLYELLLTRDSDIGTVSL